MILLLCHILPGVAIFPVFATCEDLGYAQNPGEVLK